MFWYIYVLVCLIIAIIYTKYYMQTHDYQIKLEDLENKKLQMIAIIFVSALIIAPIIFISAIYEKITY